MFTALLLMSSGTADWSRISLDGSGVTFKMPSKPTRLQKKSPRGITMTLWISESGGEEFKVGYSPFPASYRPQLKVLIQKDPSSELLKAGLESTMNAFARVQGAKVVDPQFGLDLGLPMEFADVENEHMTVHARIYVSNRAYYIFSSSSSSKTNDDFFDSIKFSSEIVRH